MKRDAILNEMYYQSTAGAWEADYRDERVCLSVCLSVHV